MPKEPCDSRRLYVDRFGKFTRELECDGADHEHNLHSAPIGDGARYVWGMRKEAKDEDK